MGSIWAPMQYPVCTQEFRCRGNFYPIVQFAMRFAESSVLGRGIGLLFVAQGWPCANRIRSSFFPKWYDPGCVSRPLLCGSGKAFLFRALSTGDARKGKHHLLRPKGFSKLCSPLSVDAVRYLPRLSVSSVAASKGSPLVEIPTT